MSEVRKDSTIERTAMSEQFPPIEIETNGTYFGSTIKINGKVVPNCTGIELMIMPDEKYARLTVHFDGVPVTMRGPGERQWGRVAER